MNKIDIEINVIYDQFTFNSHCSYILLNGMVTFYLSCFVPLQSNLKTFLLQSIELFNVYFIQLHNHVIKSLENLVCQTYLHISGIILSGLGPNKKGGK